MHFQPLRSSYVTMTVFHPSLKRLIKTHQLRYVFANVRDKSVCGIFWIFLIKIYLFVAFLKIIWFFWKPATMEVLFKWFQVIWLKSPVRSYTCTACPLNSFLQRMFRNNRGTFIFNIFNKLNRKSANRPKLCYECTR